MLVSYFLKLLVALGKLKPLYSDILDTLYIVIYQIVRKCCLFGDQKIPNRIFRLWHFSPVNLIKPHRQQLKLQKIHIKPNLNKYRQSWVICQSWVISLIVQSHASSIKVNGLFPTKDMQPPPPQKCKISYHIISRSGAAGVQKGRLGAQKLNFLHLQGRLKLIWRSFFSFTTFLVRFLVFEIWSILYLNFAGLNRNLNIFYFWVADYNPLPRFTGLQVFTCTI